MWSNSSDSHTFTQIRDRSQYRWLFDFTLSAHLQIWRGIYSRASESGRRGGSLEQSLSQPMLGGWSGDPEKIGNRERWDKRSGTGRERARQRVRVQQREKERKKPIISSAIIIPLKHWLHAATERSVQHFRVIKFWHFMTGCGKTMERMSSVRLTLRQILKIQSKEKQEFKASRGCAPAQRRFELKGYLANIC